MSPAPPDMPVQKADAAIRAGDFATAATVLETTLRLVPGNMAARQRYATLLLRNLGDPAGALEQIDTLIAREPRNAAYRAFRAAAQGQLGDYDAAIADYEAALALTPDTPGLWLRLGHALKTAGRTPEAVAAYRKSLALKPGGEAWWSLADLKTLRFDDADLAAMRALARQDLAAADAAPLHFALGKALEDAGDAAGSFAEYARGNALKHAAQTYDPQAMTDFVARARSVLTRDFFVARAGFGAPAPDPIFIVGLPRSGSTLVEQILASHSAVEGTMELADMAAVARQALGPGPFDFGRYPGALAELDADAARKLGETYLKRTQVYRRAGRPFFIDKMPNNFIHAGLIQLILPNAKIIDVRREAMACCWSAFKQNFAVGQNFSYSLGDLGRYYRDYVALMRHLDAVLPGRVHRVTYEALVAEPNVQIRALLAHLGLPFEPGVMDFHNNRRAVRTASAEQVRRPISAEGLDSWRAFEPWLGPLKDTIA